VAERRSDEPGEDRRQGERRKQDLPFEGPDRRRGKDRRRYVRRVLTGQEPLPDYEPRTAR
jgi:hypothetical protein